MQGVYLADAAKRGKPALVSEMGQFNCYCPVSRLCYRELNDFVEHHFLQESCLEPMILCRASFFAGMMVRADDTSMKPRQMIALTRVTRRAVSTGCTWLAAAGVGFIAWELMMNHDQFASFQGLVYQNGTFRNETERRCIAELATRTTRCPPIAPLHRQLDAASMNCTWHGDTDDAFRGHLQPDHTLLEPMDRPAGTAGHLKYCDIAHATVAFIVPGDASSAKLFFKRGPDCGSWL